MSEQVRNIMLELNNFTAKQVKRIALDCTHNLQLPPSQGGTPIDTGWARSNWVPSIGKPVVTPVGTKDSIDGSATDAGLAEIVANYTLDKGAIFISNNVPYIQKLNDGYSKQAPSLFIERAITKAAKDFKR